MPSLVSEANRAGMTQSQLADHEAELRGQAGQLSHDLSVGNGSDAVRPTGPGKSALDAELSEGCAIFQEFSGNAISEYKQYLLANGVPEAKIDRALRLDGIAIPAPLPSAELAELHDQIGTPIDPKPEDYNPDFDRLALELAPDRLANLKSVASQWAADLRLDKTLGRGVIEHLAETGQALAKMSGEQTAQWKQRQESALVKQAGSKAEAASIIAKAEKLLSLSGNIAGPLGLENLSASIKAGPVFHSAWLLQTLAAQSDAIATLETAKKKL